MRLLIMGPQGVGKGTQAALLSEHYNIPVSYTHLTLPTTPYV